MFTRGMVPFRTRVFGYVYLGTYPPIEQSAKGTPTRRVVWTAPYGVGIAGYKRARAYRQRSAWSPVRDFERWQNEEVQS